MPAFRVKRAMVLVVVMRRCPGGLWARWRGGVRCARAPGLISVRDLAVRRAGDVMVDGVFARDAVRPLGLWRPSTRWWRQEHAGSRPRCIGVTEGRARTKVFSGGRQALVAEVAQGVEAALEQLAGEGEAGAVAAEALGGLVVVRPVGAAGPTRRLGGLEERPAQRRWSLAREVAGGAALVGLVDGDVQAGVADGVARGGEAAASPSSARIVTAVSSPMP